jgi:predicted phosphodiesterase
MGKQITVLHLSDLHLTSDTSVLKNIDSEQFKAELLKKITEYNEKNKIDFVVVTGDIIFKGNVQDFGLAKNFFKEIENTLSLGPDKLIFVPGNHDGIRFPEYNGKIVTDNQTFQAHILTRFSDFCRFSRSFDRCTYKKISGTDAHRSFDVRNVEINGTKIRFILLNSALYYNQKGEYKKLIITNYQLENVLANCKTNFDPDITIALMHHPLDWLNPNDKQDLMRYFKDKLKIDILLHGHTHENAIYGDISPDYVILNLVSGVGVPEKKSRTGSGYKPADNYRIAFYSFDIENKTVKGNLFVTTESFVFRPDTGRYNAINNDGEFFITYKPSFKAKTNGRSNKDNEKLKSIELSNRELEKLICNGVKFTENYVCIIFDTANHKYNFNFKKKYKVISSEPEWYKGQIYCNTIPGDPQKSKDFYNNKKVEEQIRFEQLGFGAKISCWDKYGVEKFKNVKAKFICQAESANFKNFNIYYEKASNSSPLNVEQGDSVCLEYNYSMPVRFWGSYINRTISYFEEITIVELKVPQKELLKKESISVYYRTPDKRKENTPVDFTLDEFDDGKTIRITLPKQHAQFAIYWKAEEIFSLKGINTKPSRDNCQITKL